MPNIVPISVERHGTKHWQRRSSFSFASADTVTPLVAEELSTAILAMPVAFIPTDDGYTLAGVMGLTPGQNLFVNDDGAWVGHYIPATFRTSPFYLLPAENGELLLCIDEESGLVTEAPEGEAFFGDGAEPSQSISDVLSFLNQIEISRQRTNKACIALCKHNLIQPWPISMDTAEGEKRVQGLFRIDELALNALSDEAFLELREAGAFPIVYGQLLSMKNLQPLGGLYARRIESEKTATDNTAASGETFSFF